jgi:hypothetical protein
MEEDNIDEIIGILNQEELKTISTKPIRPDQAKVDEIITELEQINIRKEEL